MSKVEHKFLCFVSVSVSVAVSVLVLVSVLVAVSVSMNFIGCFIMTSFHVLPHN